ncbi:DNA repair protein RecO [Candidatus Binatia bacterium]|nr:DNA repair protein RecO [Candidatus Binatia bacterium]
MTPSLATVAIVLRSRPYGESDKIVTFLTEDAGKLTGIGKGAQRSRRRFPNCLDPFTRVRLHYRTRPGASLAFLERCDLLQSAGDLIDPKKFAYGSYLIEIVDQLTVEGHPVRDLFELLRDGLDALRAGAATASFLRGFELHLLHRSGYDPQLASCDRCRKDVGTAAAVFLDPHRGGVVCGRCSAAGQALVPVTPATLAALCALQDTPLAETRSLPLTGATAHEAGQILGHLLAPHLQRPLRSVKLIAALAS